MRRRYRGKIFFFEKCILYTEIITKTELQYRGYYSHLDIGIAFAESKNKFFLYNKKRGIREIECSADFNTIELWTESLREMMLQSIEGKMYFIFWGTRGKIIIFCFTISGRKAVKENRDSGISQTDSSGSPQFVLIRNTNLSAEHSSSSGGGSSAWNSGVSVGSNNSFCKLYLDKM